MIFEVYLDDKLLYYPNDETFVITNSKVELALNEAGSFEFDIPNSNLRYDDFNLRKSMISVRQNDTEIFYGEVREVTDNFDFTRHVYAVGELAFLFDSIQPQYSYDCTPRQMLENMLNVHNSQVEDRKKFKLGYVNASINHVEFLTNREDTLTDIRNMLCDSLDVYIRIRKVGNDRYLDLVPLVNYGRYCLQEIQFGENLLNYTKNLTASDIATCCVPLGRRLEAEERTARAVEGLDEQMSIVGTPVNDYHKKKENDYVQIDSAIAQFGYVRVVKSFDNATSPEELQTMAVDWLKSVQYETVTLELNALDMNLLDANIDSFDVGDTIHAWALPYGMDTTFPVQKKTIYINNLEQNTISLGNSYEKSYTQQNSNAIAKLMEDLPEISPILKSAKDNALAMLLAETTGGHIVYQYDDSNKYIEAINVCNATSIENSTERWVWNLNGFGFMKRDKKEDDWSEIKTAITMDGQIVANFITTGELSADRIKGGALEVGGKGYAKDGSIVVKNASGTTLVTLNKNGMTLSGGQTISYTNISDKPTIPSNSDITTIADSRISTHTFYGNSYYSTDKKSWFAPDGVTDSSFRDQTVKFKVNGDYPFRIDANGIVFANRIITGASAGAEDNWGINTGWSAMINGGIVGHPENDRYYYILNLQKLWLYFNGMGMSYDLNPISRLEASVFK